MTCQELSESYELYALGSAEPGETEAFALICERAAHDGFAGKIVVNAAQARIVNAAFAEPKDRG